MTISLQREEDGKSSVELSPNEMRGVSEYSTTVQHKAVHRTRLTVA
jgi:hypothetical protein